MSFVLARLIADMWEQRIDKERFPEHVNLLLNKDQFNAIDFAVLHLDCMARQLSEKFYELEYVIFVQQGDGRDRLMHGLSECRTDQSVWGINSGFPPHL
jgi:hypothetical protein